jgi:hypothetical protein
MWKTCAAENSNIHGTPDLDQNKNVWYLQLAQILFLSKNYIMLLETKKAQKILHIKRK